MSVEMTFQEYHLFNRCLQGDKEAIVEFVKTAVALERKECDKRIADLVEVCTWALDALLGYEQVLDKIYLNPHGETSRHINGPGACSIRDLRAIIAKESKPIETESKK